MLETCIRCGKKIDLYRNSDQPRCSYCEYDFLKEEFVTIFPFENISHIHKNFAFSQVAPFKPILTAINMRVHLKIGFHKVRVHSTGTMEDVIQGIYSQVCHMIKDLFMILIKT